MKSIQEEIDYIKINEPPKIKPVKPLEHPVNAEQHTPIYKMHRYYARRPWNVFENIIKHYTEAGDIILDPFCGGGVTIVEGLKLRRKVIGVDLNPLATFITEMEVTPLDIDEFKKAFNEVKKKAQEIILPLYKTTCSKCGNNDAYAEWYEWSNVFECPICHKEVIADSAEKLKAGIYRCINKKCQQPFKPSETIKTKEVLLRLSVNCKCGFNGVQDATKKDLDLYANIESNFKKIIKKEKLWYPKDEFLDGDLEKDHSLFKKGIKHFKDLFSYRNLLANSKLIKIISDYDCDDIIKKYLYFLFSSSIEFSNKMNFRTSKWRGGFPQWSGHSFWQPNVFCEVNIVKVFVNKFNNILTGKEQSNKLIGEFYQPTKYFDELQKDKTAFILTQSSHSLPLTNEVVDIILTDPPFGGNVQYAELCDFWVIWLKDILNTNGIIDNKFEAIQTRHSGFETEKDSAHYEDMLYKIFKECHRVLKPNGYMVMTFHNKDINVWMSLHRAANRAGFKLPPEELSETRGILYQSPIKNYTQTFHTKATGSMLGDFILSFQKMEVIDDEHKIKASLSREEEEKLIDKITHLLRYHGGADENTLMTVLVPFLMNDVKVFTDVAGFNFETFLKKYFEKDSKTKNWYTKEQFVEYYDPEKKRLRPIDFIPAEDITKNLVVSYLNKEKFATIDDLLTLIYTKLVNSNRPGIQAVQKVLDKYCDEDIEPKTKKKGFRLKVNIKPEKKVEQKELVYQFGLFGEDTMVENLSHNEIINLLAHYATELGFNVHIGVTEQRKENKFKKYSMEMKFKEDYGIASERAFKKIKEIDLLILDGNEFPAAFEVTTSIDTAREAINDRFRDLFTILPNTKIKGFIVVKNDDYQKAYEMISSAANKKDKLDKRITIIKMNKLNKDNFKEWLGK